MNKSLRNLLRNRADTGKSSNFNAGWC